MRAHFVFVTMIVALLSAPCRAERTETDPGLHEFWHQFDEGDSSIDVYSSLRDLVLTFTNSQNRMMAV
jgi:hypothetical protein